MLKNYLGCFFLLLIGLLIAVPATAAEDCVALRKGVKAEMDLQKRRQLVADWVVKCPDDPMANYKFGLSLERYRKYNEALAHYRKATTLDPTMGNAFNGMGDIYIYLGQLDDALDAYQKAGELLPGNSRATSRLALLGAKKKALSGEVVSADEFIAVMTEKEKVSTSTPLLLLGPALQYQLAFDGNRTKLQPRGEKQLTAIGQALRNEALDGVRFEITAYVSDPGLSRQAATERAQARAELIKSLLTADYGIDPARMTLAWFGSPQPLSTGRDTLGSWVEIQRPN
ncbi:MAG: hypothetical protein C0622_10290 [Desulfuromonas sp.]|nr:MAG: hypothetical protein C0622_10290 [Desulfuromonas sp.]